MYKYEVEIDETVYKYKTVFVFISSCQYEEDYRKYDDVV